MTTEITGRTNYILLIKGEPIPWTVYTKRGQPPVGFLAMQAWQEQIRAVALEKYGRLLLTGPVALGCTFYRTLPGPIPKSITVWQRRAWRAVVKRPDLTNFQKALEDALKGVLLADDSIVVKVMAAKWFAAPGEEAWTSVVVSQMELCTSGTRAGGS